MHLSVLWALPAAFGLAIWLLPTGRSARPAALAAAGAVFLYSLWLLLPYGADTGLLRLEYIGKNASLGIRYRVGVDGIGLSLCLLTTLLALLSLAASGLRSKRPPAYWAAFLFLESALLGVFTAQNLFYFYVAWDLALIPMFFIIGLWGSDNRRRAALKFILYTFVGSLSLLIGAVALAVLHAGAVGTWTLDIPELARTPVGSGGAAPWIFAAMALGFAVKIPVWPLHNWLPDAHTEAPAAGSALLAGSMLKMGVYGFLHILVPVFPALAMAALPWLGALGVINILYGALCAMAQEDLKRLVAYTSVSHLGFCLVGLASLTAEGLAGASLQMINHGLSTGGLFLLLGMMYERAHRRGVADFGGLARLTPWFAFFFALLLLSSIGMPGLNGFVGEALSLAGLVKASPVLGCLGMGGGVLAAAYGLPAYQRVFWAPPGPDSVSGKMTDLAATEQAVLWTLTALIVWLGIYPKPLLELVEPAVMVLAAR